MREHDMHVDAALFFAANDNPKPFRVLIQEDTGPYLHHFQSRIEAEAMVQTAQAVGFHWIMSDNMGLETHG